MKIKVLLSVVFIVISGVVAFHYGGLLLNSAQDVSSNQSNPGGPNIDITGNAALADGAFWQTPWSLGILFITAVVLSSVLLLAILARIFRKIKLGTRSSDILIFAAATLVATSIYTGAHLNAYFFQWFGFSSSSDTTNIWPYLIIFTCSMCIFVVSTLSLIFTAQIYKK